MDIQHAHHPRIQQLFKKGRHIAYQKNQPIIRPNEQPLGVQYIVSGWIKVVTICSDGEPNILYSLYPGDIFPLSWTIGIPQERISFVAGSNALVSRVPQDRLMHELTVNNLITAELVQMTAKIMHRLTYAQEGLHFRSARQRVAYRLLEFAEHIGRSTEQSFCVSLTVTNGDIARSSNMTRETASREISKLTREGIVSTGHGTYVIRNYDALQNIANSTTERLVPI